jgi:hypothetical protein
MADQAILSIDIQDEQFRKFADEFARFQQR